MLTTQFQDYVLSSIQEYASTNSFWNKLRDTHRRFAQAVLKHCKMGCWRARPRPEIKLRPRKAWPDVIENNTSYMVREMLVPVQGHLEVFRRPRTASPQARCHSRGKDAACPGLHTPYSPRRSCQQHTCTCGMPSCPNEHSLCKWDTFGSECCALRVDELEHQECRGAFIWGTEP